MGIPNIHGHLLIHKWIYYDLSLFIINPHNGPNMAFTNDLSMGAPGRTQDDPIRAGKFHATPPRRCQEVPGHSGSAWATGRWLPRYLMYYTNYT